MVQKAAKEFMVYCRGLQLAMERVQEVEGEAAALIENIRQRLDAERETDAVRLSELEEAIKDRPYYRLFLINQELSQDDVRAGESVNDFWLAQYGHRNVGRRLHELDRKRLEKEKAQLEIETKIHSATPEEREFFSLQTKIYQITANERVELMQMEKGLNAFSELFTDALKSYNLASQRLDEAITTEKKRFGADIMTAFYNAKSNSLEAVQKMIEYR